jgi:plasmid maintenance system killer protein
MSCLLNIESVARRRLNAVHAAHVLSDLLSPPGNRLEKLSGDRAGQHSIRINDQWRVCFVWTSHEFWMNLQAYYDVEMALIAAGKNLGHIKPLAMAA